MNFKTKLKKATSIWDKLCHQSLTLLGAMILVGISGFALSATAKEANSKDAPRFRLVEPTSGYVYFNRPKANLAALQEEMKFCITEAHFILPSDHEIVKVIINGTVSNFGSVITSLMYDGPTKAVAVASVESCMVVRGWRVVRVSESEGRELSSLSQSELTGRISPWIGAEEPHGEIVRVWSNEAIHASSYELIRPKLFVEGQLTWKLLAIDVFKETQSISPTNYMSKPDAKWPIKMPIGTLKITELAKAPEGSGLIVFRIQNANKNTIGGIAFVRQGIDKYDHPSSRDHAPEIIGMAEYGEKWVLVPVYPGRWRLAGIASTSFCLGSPGFDIQAGEVIYAGTFDLSSDDMRPNLDIAPAKEYLKATLQAEKIKPASYINGLQGICSQGGVHYALEIDGAPFEPNYTWGSAAK